MANRFTRAVMAARSSSPLAATIRVTLVMAAMTVRPGTAVVAPMMVGSALVVSRLRMLAAMLAEVVACGMVRALPATVAVPTMSLRMLVVALMGPFPAMAGMAGAVVPPPLAVALMAAPAFCRAAASAALVSRAAILLTAVMSRVVSSAIVLTAAPAVPSFVGARRGRPDCEQAETDDCRREACCHSDPAHGWLLFLVDVPEI